MTVDAPFFADLADGPEGGHALWLTAEDGVRLRVAVWPQGSKGTVLILPGRTECAEKYGRTAADLGRRGYASVAVDFPTDGGGDLPLYLSDAANNIVAATQVKRRVGLPSVQSWPAGENEWYATASDTRDAANNPLRETAVVITEIMANSAEAELSVGLTML